MNLPDGVTSIGALCFCRCSRLTSINIPIGITSVNMLTFYSCSSLESVTIPNNVSYISFGAFADCDKIKDISCCGEHVVNADSDAFPTTVIENATLHVPSALFDNYNNTEPWSGFRNIVKNETSINTIPTDVKRNIRIFSVDGKERHSLGKGLNILLQADGKVIKVAK